jgi:hypothetical protein
VPLRPIGVGELLDGALGLIRSNPKTVLGLATAVSAISALVQTVGLWLSFRALGTTDALVPVDDAATFDSSEFLAAQLTAGAAQLVPALVASFLQILASGLFIVLVAAAVLGRRLDIGQTWQLLRPRLLPLVGLSLLLLVLGTAAFAALIGVIVLLAFTLGEWAVLPGLALGLGGAILAVYAYVKLAVASPALVIEGVGPIGALGRSWRLVRGSFWRVLGILLLALVITSVLTGIITAPLTILGMLVSGVEGDLLLSTVITSGVATLLAGILTLPFTAAVTGLLYTDLRMRREALDIQLVAAGVDPQGDPLAPYRAHPGA